MLGKHQCLKFTYAHLIEIYLHFSSDRVLNFLASFAEYSIHILIKVQSAEIEVLEYC